MAKHSLHCAAAAAPLPLPVPTGTHKKNAGQPGWRQCYERAARICPAYAPANYNLGARLAALLPAAALARGPPTADGSRCYHQA